ncbi:MAG TPA: folate-binding protein [Rubrivivax sp.]|nr:folate-binding protein [Rubrivivax sp.]
MTTASLDTTRFDGALRLHDWGLIRAAGADAASFLHGQLTQDVLHLDPAHARLAGYCSAKGRLLASFVMWRGGADEILLACSADLLPATLKRRSMFVLRSRCKLSDASNDLALYGLAGPGAARWLGQGAPTAPWQRSEIAGGDAIRLPDADAIARWLWAAPAAGPAPALPPLDAEAWRWLEVASGVVRITAATAEQFVPQMVNLELVGGVNFQKGCYPGQEVVARSQYRGTVKRRTQRVTASAALVAGQEVFHGADTVQPAGRVALAASLDGEQHAALVELKLAALDGAELHAGPARLEVGALPYEIPADVA